MIIFFFFKTYLILLLMILGGRISEVSKHNRSLKRPLKIKTKNKSSSLGLSGNIAY